MIELERKYSPMNLHVLAATHLFFEQEYVGKSFVGGVVPKHEFRIFIRQIDTPDRCFLISSEPSKHSQLAEGICSGTIWRHQNISALKENGGRLGEVIVERNGKVIKNYGTFEEFWTEIRR